MPVWDAFLTERDRKVFAASGYGATAGFKDRPALLVIDINMDFVGDRPEPILDSNRRFPNSCGAVGWQAMERLVPLLDAARAKRVPVLYSTSDNEHGYLDRTSWAAKNSLIAGRLGNLTYDRTAIPEMIAPQPGDAVIRKKKPSVFIGTPLVQYLTAWGINQLICCGTTTSGCVRATVVDAFSQNLRVAVIEECTFDRGEASHAINLFDMDQKYADVVSAERVAAYIAALPEE